MKYTKYEKARIIGARALQLAMGAPLLLKLTKEGFETEIANNGAWGLKLAAHGDFDIILLDMVMPVMDGYEVLKQIKKDLRTQKVPVLVFSNSAQDEEIAKVLEMGARDYFLKSKMTPAQVVEEVKNVLKE